MTVLVLLAPLNNGAALLARGERAAIALAQAADVRQIQPPSVQAQPGYLQPSNYTQLRANCANDSDAPLQIVGCNAILANPAERARHAIATNNRGHARERGGDLNAALGDYDQAITLDAGYVVAHINRGRVLMLLGRPDEALAAFDRSIAVEDGGWGRLERGRVHAARRDYPRALADLDMAVRLLPGDAEALMERDRARASQAASAPPSTSRPRNALDSALASVGQVEVRDAPLRALLRPLPAADALIAHTRQVIGPVLASSVPIVTSATPRVLSATPGEPGLPTLVIAWVSEAATVEPLNLIASFERGVDRQCQERRPVAEEILAGVRVSAFSTICPGVNVQLWTIVARDAERTQLLAFVAPLQNSDAVLSRGRMLLQHLGIRLVE